MWPVEPSLRLLLFMHVWCCLVSPSPVYYNANTIEGVYIYFTVYVALLFAFSMCMFRRQIKHLCCFCGKREREREREKKERERERERHIIINSSGSYNCWLNNILRYILKVVIILQVIVVASAAAAAGVVVVGLELI